MSQYTTQVAIMYVSYLLANYMNIYFLKLIAILISVKIMVFAYLFIDEKWDHVSHQKKLPIRLLDLGLTISKKGRLASRKRKKYPTMILWKDKIMQNHHHRCPKVRDKKWSKELRELQMISWRRIILWRHIKMIFWWKLLKIKWRC